MIYIKENLCDFCGTCVSVCPVDCIELFEAKIELIMKNVLIAIFVLKVCPLDVLEVKDEK